MEQVGEAAVPEAAHESPELIDEIYLPLNRDVKPVHEVLMKMLLSKINNTDSQLDPTVQMPCHFYEKLPADLIGQNECTFEDKHLFFVNRKKKGNDYYNRRLLDLKGLWRNASDKQAILDSITNATIGYHSLFRLWLSGSNNKCNIPTKYRMIEYALESGCDMALCLVYEKKTKTPKKEKDARKEREKAMRTLNKAKQAAATREFKAKEAAKMAEKAKKQCEEAKSKVEQAKENFQKASTTPAAVTPDVPNETVQVDANDEQNELEAVEDSFNVEVDVDEQNELEAVEDSFNVEVDAYDEQNELEAVEDSFNVQVERDVSTIVPSFSSSVSPRVQKSKKRVSRCLPLREESYDDDIEEISSSINDNDENRSEGYGSAGRVVKKAKRVDSFDVEAMAIRGHNNKVIRAQNTQKVSKGSLFGGGLLSLLILAMVFNHGTMLL